MTRSLAEISDAMKQIDFCTLATQAGGGAIGARPMSNNRNVEYDGDAWFFTYGDRRMVVDIERDPHVGVTYLGSAGLKRVGWKIGLTSKAMQSALAIDIPDSGFLFDDMMFPDGGTVPAGRFIQPRVEPSGIGTTGQRRRPRQRYLRGQSSISKAMISPPTTPQVSPGVVDPPGHWPSPRR